VFAVMTVLSAKAAWDGRPSEWVLPVVLAAATVFDVWYPRHRRARLDLLREPAGV
jgi:hypothetical protein